MATDKAVHNFTKACEAKYQPQLFHNFAHAADGLYATSRALTTSEADQFLPEHVQFWLLVAAIGHDLGHMGYNNPYLIETSHELAVMYNDRSPLENMHCSKLFETLALPDGNVFSKVDRRSYKDLRPCMITA